MQSKEWNEDTVRALVVYERVLGIIGVWPLGVGSAESLARWLLATMIQISTIGSLTLEVYRHCIGVEDTMDAFLMDLSSVVSLSKLLLVRLNWKHTLALVRSIAEDWTSCADRPQRRLILSKFTDRGRLVSLTILYLGYASGISFVAMALPLDRFLPFLATASVENGTQDQGRSYFLAVSCTFGNPSLPIYGAVLMLQVVQIFVNATAHCGNDGFFFGITMHVCGQYELLKADFASLGVNQRDYRSQLKELVKRHSKLARMVDNLESSFNVVILVQLLMSALLLCVEGFQLLLYLKLNQTFAAAKHAVIIVTLLVQLFLYSYAGDVLETQTAGVAFAVYDSPWYTFDAKTVRDLSLIIFHGSIPHRVTAGKFIPMNLYTFKEILKTSASYLSVLRVMMEV